MTRVVMKFPQYSFTYDKKRLRNTLRSAATEVVNVARSKVKKSAGGGRTYYYKGKKYSASTAGNPIANRSGAVAASVKGTVRKDLSGFSVKIGGQPDTFYGKFAETGAVGGTGNKGGRNIYVRVRNSAGRRVGVLAQTNGIRVEKPRPFVSTAFAERTDSIRQRIEDSLRDDVKFVRIKV